MVAERELQSIRSNLEELRLRADVVLPAEARQAAKELVAVGEAAGVREDGRAMKEVMTILASAWHNAGEGAADMIVIRQLESVLEQVAVAVEGIDIGSVNLVDSGDGKALPAYVASYPAMVTAILKEINNAVGVDLTGALKGSNGGAQPPQLAVPIPKRLSDSDGATAITDGRDA